MPSAIHEGIVRLFQANPGLAAILLGEVLGIELPEHVEVLGDSSSFSEMKPPEYRADMVSVLKREDGTSALSVIVEVQLSVKERKRAGWLAYTATATRQQGCEACVLVVTPDVKVARWAREPLTFGLISKYAPLVIGPEEMPMVADAAEAKRRPYLAVLSAVAHGHANVEKSLRAANLARDAIVPLADGDVYFDLIKASLSEEARKAFEMLAETYEYQDESLRKSFHKGEAKAVLVFLKARGVSVSEEESKRIMACADSKELEAMVVKAATVQSASELFN